MAYKCQVKQTLMSSLSWSQGSGAWLADDNRQQDLLKHANTLQSAIAHKSLIMFIQYSAMQLKIYSAL